MHHASVNKAPGLPLTMGLSGELFKNAELGREAAAEGFNGLAFDPFTQGRTAE
jgi:hypothetical protein